MAEVRGIDISSWQHPAGRAIDWTAVADSGIAFVVIKATQGLGYVNPWLRQDYEGAFGAGLLVGAYHFAELGPDGRAQGEFFTEQLVGLRLEMGAWIDWEINEAPQWQATSLYTPLVEAAEEARPGLGIYCDESWRALLGEYQLPVRRLWLAAPGTTRPATRCALWQSGSGEVPGVPAPVDLDVATNLRAFNLQSAPAAPRPVASVDARADEERVATGSPSPDPDPASAGVPESVATP